MANQWWARLVLGRTAVTDPLQDPDAPDTRPDAEWRPPVKTRLVVMLGLLGLWAVGVEAKLVYLQVLQHEAYQAKAEKQQQNTLHPEAPRGDILDRNGQLLAYSVESYDVHANPVAMQPDGPGQARAICDVLADCSADDLAQITAKLSKPRIRDVIIRPAQALTADAAIRLQAMIDAGPKDKRRLWLEPKIWRYYPNRELAAHAVGYLMLDGEPGGGVESSFNSTIRGVPGVVITQVDAHDQEFSSRVTSPPVPGTSVELTIDQTIQYFADRELAAVINATGAASGSVVVMDPRTGEIFALASHPTFNPNDPGKASDDTRRNRTVQDAYEPGSTLKIVTASAALNEGLMRPSDMVDTNPGRISIPGRSKPIHDDKNRNHGVLSFEDVIVQSSNVGAVMIGQRVGPQLMAQYAFGFGLGQKITPNLLGESRGFVNPANKLTESALASMSMGHEVMVTPVQMATVASVIANGGMLIEPHLVRAEIRNGQRREIQPRVIRRAIAPDTAAAITAIMEAVVERGTGKPAALDRYRVAGKTGTAQKASQGRYNDQDYVVSFVGFVPSRDPVFTILVVVDSPRLGSKYGAAVAAPVFKRIAEAALQYVGVRPSINPLPPVIVASDRTPLPVQSTRAADTAPAITRLGGQPVMPDLRGMTMRDAVRLANTLGLPITSMDGDGVVVSQTPAPGAVIGPSDRGTLELRRVRSGGNPR